MKIFSTLIAAATISAIALAGTAGIAEAGKRSYSKYYSGNGSSGTSLQNRKSATSYHRAHSGAKIATGCERHRLEWEKTGNGRALGRYYRCIYG